MNRPSDPFANSGCSHFDIWRYNSQLQAQLGYPTGKSAVLVGPDESRLTFQNGALEVQHRSPLCYRTFTNAEMSDRRNTCQLLPERCKRSTFARRLIKEPKPGDDDGPTPGPREPKCNTASIKAANDECWQTQVRAAAANGRLWNCNSNIPVPKPLPVGCPPTCQIVKKIPITAPPCKSKTPPEGCFEDIETSNELCKKELRRCGIV